jgi:hypothetical protein
MGSHGHSGIDGIKQALMSRARGLEHGDRTRELGELLLFLVGLADLHHIDLFDAGRAALDALSALAIPSGHA